MSCTIVIPHKDRLAHLTWCLRALKNQITQTPFEVIVVDDGSKVLPVNGITPGNFPENIRFINQNNKGAASARNAGWMASEQDFIIFLDCDQIVSPRFVQNHLITFQQTQAHVMQLGTRRHLKPNLKIDLKTVRDEKCYPDERLFFFRKASFNLANLEIAWHLGFSHNMSIRRSDLIAHGGFDENFVGWGFEDCELTYRMQQAGVPSVLNPAVEACHQAHNQKMTPQKFQRWEMNLKYFMQKFPNAEIDVQKALIPVCDPANPKRIKWSQALLQMETLLRLSNGRALCTAPQTDIACTDMSDLHKIAASPECQSTRALITPQNIELFIKAQLDPALKEVRVFVG